eukprot:244132-Chlamydomonas_euryale.AAC.2
MRLVVQAGEAVTYMPCCERQVWSSDGQRAGLSLQADDQSSAAMQFLDPLSQKLLHDVILLDKFVFTPIEFSSHTCSAAV